MEIKDGGSAFPVFEATRAGLDYDNTSEGMTMRDWFAGQALAGIATHFDGNLDKGWNRSDEINAARFCYRVADRMLEAREA